MKIFKRVMREQRALHNIVFSKLVQEKKNKPLLLSSNHFAQSPSVPLKL